MTASISRQNLRGASRALLFTNGSRSAFCCTRRRGFADVAENDTTLPLKGYKVLDMTRVLAGVRLLGCRFKKYANNTGSHIVHKYLETWGTIQQLLSEYDSQMLTNISAEVIKIEHPTKGDDTRHWGPPYAKYKEGSGQEGPGESAYFFAVNRNKKSLGLSFQHKSGVDILHKLVAESDILVENYLPGTLKKYGMDFETLNKINPRLIYASITGYGQTGPYSNRAGYDVMVEAEFGLMHITGSRDGPPVKVGVAVTDLTTGLYTSNSIMAAIIARARTNRGQHIDVALSDCQVATLANIASSCLHLRAPAHILFATYSRSNMASDAPPQTPAAPGSGDASMSDSPPKYVPQFSAATEMILKRIQSGSGSLTGSSSLSSIGMTGPPPGYEDMKRNVMMGMKTSMNMEIPSPPIGNRQRAGAAGRTSVG
ncbi:Succinate--hydroxymethylglutarate CoA-transferase, partial [Lachnellula willkommii]